MSEYIKSFLYGGLFITIIKYLSKFTGKYAGIFAALPIGLLASFFLNNDNNKKSYYIGYLTSIFILFIVTLLIFLSSIYFINTQVNIISFFGLILWIIFSIYAVKKYDITQYTDTNVQL